jgi:hypothetical protein
MSRQSETRQVRRVKKRSYNTRRVKRDYPYFLREIADLFSVHPNAVRHWIKAGLSVVDDRRPLLINGGDLIDFLNARQAKRKQKCAGDELFCFRCRRPRHPRFGRVDVLIRGGTRVQLRGECETCGTRMYRAGSAAKFAEYEKALTLQTEGQGRLKDGFQPSVTCHLEEVS